MVSTIHVTAGEMPAGLPTLSVELTPSAAIATNQLYEAPKRAYIGLKKL
jgi:hypothetical protein